MYDFEALDVACPECLSVSPHPCLSRSGDPVPPHRSRIQAARIKKIDDAAKAQGVTPLEQSLPRDQRQQMIASWAEMAFGREEAVGIPQRGLRLLEEAIELFQACGGGEVIAHELVTYVFGRPPGEIGQELGGVGVTVLALAAATDLSADLEEAREIHRVLTKPLREFSARNASKNAAGFKIP